MTAKVTLSLVLPVHNQETIISKATADINRALQTLGIKYEIILVENGSTDDTLRVVREIAKKEKGVKVLTSPKGYGSAVIAGLAKARGFYVSYMPSDGQLDPRTLGQIYKLISLKTYDMVKIRRTNRESFLRKFQSFIFNLLTRLLYPITLTDINGSPRIMKRSAIKKLALVSGDSFIDCEMAVKAHYLGWKILEVPAKTYPRLGGKSTVSYKTVMEFIYNLIFFRNSRYLRQWKAKTKK